MACGSCAERARMRAEAAANAVQGVDTGVRPKYTVISPDGSRTTFDEYIDAATFKREVNGTLTTHT